MRILQRNRIDESHTNTMQGKEHTDHMVTCKEPMATPEHPMAQDHPGDNLRMRLHQPTIGQTKRTQPATSKEDNAPGPDPTPPNPPIGIGVLDMGLEMRKSYTRKAAI